MCSSRSKCCAAWDLSEQAQVHHHRQVPCSEPNKWKLPNEMTPSKEYLFICEIGNFARSCHSQSRGKEGKWQLPRPTTHRGVVGIRVMSYHWPYLFGEDLMALISALCNVTEPPLLSCNVGNCSISSELQSCLKEVSRSRQCTIFSTLQGPEAGI